MAGVLHELTRPKGKFQWTTTHEVAFFKLKESLVCAPTLTLPQRERMFILYCDASDYAIGCELSQVQDRVEQTVCYGSYSLTPEQKKYCTTRKELLAIIRFTRQFRHYRKKSAGEYRSQQLSMVMGF